MRKSEWLLATSILLVGFGFGHAGCYTSGLPGGHGAGGASYSDAGVGGGSDASAATGGSATCKSKADCASRKDSNHVCTQDWGVCVACIVDKDCLLPADAGVPGAGGNGGAPASSDLYCYKNSCIPILTCQNNADCPSDHDSGICTSNHCFQCATDQDCKYIGGSSTTCSGHLCRTPCTSGLVCKDLSTLKVDCTTSDGGLGFCTEVCTRDSDCYPGNVCRGQLCVPAS